MKAVCGLLYACHLVHIVFCISSAPDPADEHPVITATDENAGRTPTRAGLNITRTEFLSSITRIVSECFHMTQYSPRYPACLSWGPYHVMIHCPCGHETHRSLPFCLPRYQRENSVTFRAYSWVVSSCHLFVIVRYALGMYSKADWIRFHDICIKVIDDTNGP